MAAIIKRLQPLYDKVLTTANRYETAVAESGLIEDEKTEGYIKLHQTVLAVNENSNSGIMVGDTVLINPQNYLRPVHSTNKGSVTERDDVSMEIAFPVLDVDGKECLFISCRDIEAIVEVEETSIVE